MDEFQFGRRPTRINLEEYRATLTRSSSVRPENNLYCWLLGPILVYLLVTFTGYHESLANQVYARHVYLPKDIEQNATFIDIVTVSPDGGRVIDLANFEKWVPNTSDRIAGEFL